MKRERAWELRKMLMQAAESLDDKSASVAPEFYPKLTGGGNHISAGTRINWRGQLKRAAAGLYDFEHYNPDNAPDLWEDIAYKMGYRMIPDAITAGLAFALDECGWRGDVLYRSKIAGNVWTPEAYPDGWEVVNA